MHHKNHIVGVFKSLKLHISQIDINEQMLIF